MQLNKQYILENFCDEKVELDLIVRDNKDMSEKLLSTKLIVRFHRAKDKTSGSFPEVFNGLKIPSLKDIIYANKCFWDEQTQTNYVTYCFKFNNSTEIKRLMTSILKDFEMHEKKYVERINKQRREIVKLNLSL